ncbi:MAG: EamA family transporter [Acidimicrobiales bacterium]
MAAPQLSSGVLFVVLGAGVLHAVWNAITKAVEDRLVVFAWIGTALAVSGGTALVFTGLPARAALIFLVASAVVHVAYDLALMNAYRLGSFNQMYPIARGTSPLLVTAGAALFAQESLGALELVGVLLLAGGLVSLALSAGRINRSELPAVGAALLTGVAIASYSLLDGLGVRRSGDAFAYVAMLFVFEGPVLVAAAVIRRPVAAWTRDRIAVRGLLAGLLSFAAYGAVVWAQSRAPLAEVAALRETGVISAAVIGAVFFQEGFGYRRIVSAVVVAVGIAMIGL